MTVRSQPPASRRQPPRRRRAVPAPRRFAPLAATAVLSLLAGTVVGARHVPAEHRAVAQFALDWQRGDYAGMYALLSDDARRRVTLPQLRRSYAAAADALTLQSVRTGRVRDDGDVVQVPVVLRTRMFGRLYGMLAVPTGKSDAAGAGVDWSPALLFPGLSRGERLRRTTQMPPRAALEADDGSVIAGGPQRTSTLGPAVTQVAGSVGPAPAKRHAELAAAGVPANASVGLTGLELEFDAQLRGTPGGTLYAGTRELARKPPVKAAPVRTTIDPAVQRAAVAALGDTYGGVVAMQPRTGAVLALAGIAQSAPQPPGSTFKIVTLTGVLEHKLVSRTATFPYETQTEIEGVAIQNANGESCGGTLEASFADSCNSVFAPLGAKLGATALVATAERYGFNQSPVLKSAATSTIPAAAEIGDALAVGSSAIGQGKVQATPLQMAVVAATIADDGERPIPTLLHGATPRHVRVTTRAVARTINAYMRSVVAGGTGAAAAIPGVAVAGKTGTAELRDTVPPNGADTTDGDSDQGADTDAWFTSFAPANKPRIVVCVLLPANGAGGDTAAPVARQVLLAGLQR